MAKLILILGTLIAVYGLQEPLKTHAEIINFSKGLLQGLSTDPYNACTIQANTDFDATAVRDILDDIEQNIMSLSYFHFYAFHYLHQDISQLLYLLTPTITNCDFKGFLTQLDGHFSTEGLREMMKNLKTNSATIKKNMIEITQCGQNYSVCGKYLGETIQLILGSGI